MAINEHLKILEQGVEVWNKWVEEIRGERIQSLHGSTEDDFPVRLIDLSWLDLSGVDLRNANLSGVDLYNTVLKGADLRGAGLAEADIRGANLQTANLSHAILSSSDLSSAYLEGANFHQITLLDTVFANVDLRAVKGLESVKHDGPSYISIDTIYRSEGKIPEIFLRGCGVPESFIIYMHSRE